MKSPLDVDMYMKKMLSIGFVVLLLMSMAAVATADPWDSVVDNPTPAQAVWVDPRNTTGLALDDEFVVDVICNITDPDGGGPATGLFGFEYKLFWNSTILQVESIEYHSPWPTLLFIQNETGVWSGGPYDGYGYHWLGLVPMSPPSYTGFMSLCSYRFKVLWQPEETAPDFCGLLDLYETEFTDDTATVIISDTVPEGTTLDGMYCVSATANPPTIDVPSRIPAGDVLPDEDVKVLVNVTDAESGVKNATLSYTLNNGTSWTDVLMTYNATSSLYEATIPGQPAETWVKFKIIAYDNAGNNATRDGTEPYCVYKVIPEFPAASITLLFMVMALAAVILGKAAWSRKRSSAPVAE